MEGRRLNERTALLLSLGGTVVSWQVIALGLSRDHETLAMSGLLGSLVAPNLGHWYQGTGLTRSTGLRAAGALAAFYGAFIGLNCDGCGDRPEYLFVAGALLYLGATVDDIIDAPRRARKHNRRLEQLRLAPAVTGHGAGLALGGRF